MGWIVWLALRLNIFLYSKYFFMCRGIFCAFYILEMPGYKVSLVFKKRVLMK